MNPQGGAGAPGAPNPTQPPTGQVPPTGVGSENTPPSPPATPPTGQVPPAGTPSGEPQLTLEQALDALNKMRAEEAANRQKLKRLADLEAEKTAAQQAIMTELEREKAARTAAEARNAELQTQAINSEIALAAVRLNLHDPTDAVGAIAATVATITDPAA